MEIVFATQNQNKVKEIQQLLPDTIQILSLADINCHEDIPETAETLEGNASLKSEYVVKKFNQNCFADDTGLEIDALNGQPGVFSARYAGDGKNAEANMEKVLKEMEGKANRKARFRTAISLRLGNEEHLFEGIVHGTIPHKKSGSEGFGYDPIFQPDGFDVTFAEMPLTQKNKISHRAKAMEQLVKFVNLNYK